MIMDDPGPATFDADPHDEYRLSFTVPAVLERGGRRTIMTMRCFEEEKLRGLTVWLGEHQDLWSTWRKIAETLDGNTLSAKLVDLMARESRERFGRAGYLCERVTGAAMQRTGRPCEASLVVQLATRFLPIITHAFADERSLGAFMASIMNGDRDLGPVALAELALLKGRMALARRLDEIARTQDVLSRRIGQ